jgi:C4-dicarboxylate transporter DctM subunit
MEGVILGFIIVIALIVMGVPIAMAFGVLAFILLAWFNQDASYLLPTIFIKMRSVVLLSVPLFILFGSILDTSGLAGKMIDFVNSIGQIIKLGKSGLGTVTVAATAMFSAISGTDSAAIACIGTIMIPRLVAQGYQRGHATALIACSGILGQLVPPSVPMIFYAIMTGNSVPGCWLATLGPAIIIVIMYSFLNMLMVRNLPLKMPPKLPTLKEQTKAILVSTYRAIPILVLPVVVLGGVYGGVVTPTEAACLGVVYVIVAGCLFYRTVRYEEIKSAMISASVISGVVLVMIFFTEITSKILIVEGITESLSNWVVAHSPNIFVTLAMLNIVLLFMGMIMNDLSGTVLAAALLYPIAINAGVHPLHFAAIVGVNMGLGTVTPPTAPMLYLAGRIGNSSAEEYMKPALFLMWVGMLPVVIITTYWPGLSLYMPSLAGYSR